ncbi:CLUMA_CG000972, isoform A [Clunio marinus]|uniref:Gustatory receptor n=1 Tax=Clunio marinus TaxID=568069 RepID=A0A1J1HID2_9DIPT|nr:CLUMA_CG000972, isoform A [Clunio marinus]
MFSLALDSIQPLLILTKLFGFSFFTLDEDTFEVKFAKVDVLCVLFNLVIEGIIHINYWGAYFYLPNTSEIVNIVLPSVAYLNCCVLLFSKVWLFCNRHKIKVFLRLLCGIDSDFENLNFKFDYKKQRHFVIKLMVLVIFIWTVLSLSTLIFHSYYHYMEVKTYNCFILFMWAFFLNMVLISQFLVFIFAIRDRFIAINHMIRSQGAKQKLIVQLAEIRIKLFKTCTLINEVFSPTMIYPLAMNVCLVCLFIFNTFVSFKDIWRNEILFIASASCLKLHQTVSIVCLMWVCEATLKEDQKILYNLFENLVKTQECEKSQKQILQFTHQISNMKIKFSCGLFEFNWRLCFQMISAVAMYFFILIQLENAIPKNV